MFDLRCKITYKVENNFFFLTLNSELRTLTIFIMEISGKMGFI